MGRLFGTDGIRGEANRYPMDGVTAFSVGQAVTRLLRRPDHRVRIVIGMDTRISGPMLENALMAGIISMGGDPCPVGVLPTPGIALMTLQERADAGIVISASHNPYEDNGIKIFSGKGLKLSDEQEERIEDLILKGDLPKMVPPAREMGRVRQVDDHLGRYITFLRQDFPGELSMEGMKVVIDTANGATYRVAPDLFASFGTDLEVIHDSPDGININHLCGSQHTADLSRLVKETGAEIGLAFDGDGDRLIAVDERGKEITGDQILLICARRLKAQGKLKNDLIVSSVMSNLGLTAACKSCGIKRHESKVGDRYVLEDMKRLGAVVGGEESGHIILLDHHTTSDGMITAMQLLAEMIEEDKPLSELAAMMEVYPQSLINVEVKRKPEISTVPGLMETIRQVEAELGDHGRILVRYSGTQQICRIMVEGPTDDLTERYCSQIADEAKTALG